MTRVIDLAALPTDSGIVFPEGTSLNIDSNTLYIDSTNNRIGIGTSSPATPLSILRNGTIVSTGLDASTVLTLQSTGATGSSTHLNLLSGSTGSTGQSVITFGDEDDPGIGAIIYRNADNSLAFKTNTTEHIRITSTGNVGIGTSSPVFQFQVGTTNDNNLCGINTNSSIPRIGADTARLVVETTSTYTQGLYARCMSSSVPFSGIGIGYGIDPNNIYNAAIKFQAALSTTPVTRFEVRANGGVANYQANNANLSDEREKTNIELSGNYLEKICNIPVKTFTYIDQALDDNEKTIGVIAQDVESQIPELVMESNWGSEESPKIRKSIYQTDLQYVLMKCIQEQQDIIKTLETRIQTLENN